VICSAVGGVHENQARCSCVFSRHVAASRYPSGGDHGSVGLLFVDRWFSRPLLGKFFDRLSESLGVDQTGIEGLADPLSEKSEWRSWFGSLIAGSAQDGGCARQPGKFRVCFLTWGGCVAWILRLVKTGAEGDGQSTDVMKINKPDDLSDIADLCLSLAAAKLLLAAVQRDIVAAQARAHADRRPKCRCGGVVCHVKDYRDHAIATLFGQATVRLPRFRCAACGVIEIGIDWPSHCRSTPELDQLQAHLSAR
jgi:hypothetical protein